MTRQLLAVLREGFEGPNGKVTYFLDSDGGLTKTLAWWGEDNPSSASGTFAPHEGRRVSIVESRETFPSRPLAPLAGRGWPTAG